MFKNYLKIAWRNLGRHKLFTGLNIFGLAMGMACCILIFLWVQGELSYDKFNTNADKIYRITSEISDVETAVAPPPLAATVKEEISAVRTTTKLVPLRKMITAGMKKFDEKNIYYADTNFLKMFSYPLLTGNAETVLSEPNAVVITEATAIKYFKSTEAAVGKTIYIDDNIEGRNLVVTGILKNIPPDSHLQFDLLLPIAHYYISNPAENWDNYAAYIYLQLADNFTATPSAIKRIEGEINAIKKRKDKSGIQSSLSLQALTDIHLHSHFMLDVDGQGNIRHVTIFSLVAIFILLIACINFINLSTALSSQRAKEIGLRKTAGAQRSQLVIQFLGESLLISFISVVLAVVLIALLLPLFNELASKSVSFNLLNLKLAGLLFATAVLTGILSGSYPALVLSSFHPVKVLKGVKVLGNRKSFLRNGLVILQFSISVILMISTLVVYVQREYIQNRDIGFEKENLLYVKMPEVGDLKDNKDALKDALSQYPGMSDYTISDHLPTYLTASGPLSWPTMDPDKQVIVYRLRTDKNFIKTFGMQLLAGRFFSEDFKSDDSNYVVNETALSVMNMKPATAIGKKIKIGVGGREGTIIGVVKDFNFKPVKQPVEPLVIRNNFSGGYLVMRTSPDGIQNTIAQIEKIFDSIYADYPFSYGFVNEDLSKLYLAEQQMGRLFNIFSVLSIIISCLGLFGLAVFTAQRRVKEIGIRKVLGASASGIVTLLSKDFIKLVLIAILIATPLAWYAMNRWLQDFAYRIDLQWWMFALAGLLAVIIALLTVSFQSVKAALANPVKSLRSE